MKATGTSLVILQSNYLPWKGYFDLMAAADEFVIYDEVQFTKNDWRNRNRIVLNGKPHWLTIAAKTSGAFGLPIDRIEVANRDWSRVHLETLGQAYRKAPFFREMFPPLEAAYTRACQLSLLSEVNELFLRSLAQLLGVETRIERSTAVTRVSKDPTARLIEICVARGATTYISGPAAKAYIDKSKFDAAGIELKYANYSGYPVYDQGSETFEHGVSIVDVLMRCGSDARGHLKSLRDRNSFLDAA